MLGALQTGARRIKEDTLELTQQEVQRNQLPNQKGKGVAAVVICADPGEEKEENLALPAAVITTLQQSTKFKNLIDQLGLTAKERKIATEALVSIASGAGVECLSAEMPEDRPSCRNQQKSLLVVRIWRWGTQIIGDLSI